MHFTSNSEYWSKRYNRQDHPWDLHRPSRPIIEYFTQLKNRESKILIPGAGPGHEVGYLYEQGFKQVYYMDFSDSACSLFKATYPNFPADQILSDDFFNHGGKYDFIVEQTFFCALEPSRKMRKKYADSVYQLLKNGGKLIGLWWNFPLDPPPSNPPYGGSKEEYLGLFEEKLTTQIFDTCYNSAEERAGKEWFGVFSKKS